MKESTDIHRGSEATRLTAIHRDLVEEAEEEMAREKVARSWSTNPSKTTQAPRGDMKALVDNGPCDVKVKDVAAPALPSWV